MKLNEAIAAVIDEQYNEYVETTHRIGLDPRGRDLFALQNVNFRIPAEIDRWIEYPEGTDFGTFNNCREYGVTYTYNGWTFCVYEHRNSDSICIEGCPTSEIRSYGPYGLEDKYDTLTTDYPEDYERAARRLMALLLTASPAATREDMKAVANSDYERLIADNRHEIAAALRRVFGE